MTIETACTVFTDLKDSTKSQLKLGSSYDGILREHLKVGQILAERNIRLSGDEYKKNIGDAHMIVFRSIDAAIDYAVQMQQMHAVVPALTRNHLGLRIGIGLGTLSQEDGDAFGPGVNESARVSGAADAGEIVLNEQLANNLRVAWGDGIFDSYVLFQKEVEQKGIGVRTLYWFNWKKFGQDHTERGLSQLVRSHFEAAKVELFNVSLQRLAAPGTIIWPVVPRDLATAIHRAQTEIVRLMALLGWRLTILISDCGTAHNLPRKYSESFQEHLRRHLARRQINVENWLFMSDLYAPSFTDYSLVQTKFRLLAQHFKLGDLLQAKEKDLPQDQKAEIRSQSTLGSLVPILTSAAVLYLAEASKKENTVVLAGKDENFQWEHTLLFRDTELAWDLIGIIMNPVLKDNLPEGQVQKRHTKGLPIWYSQQHLLESLGNSNLAWWLFRLCCFLPAFPATSVDIDGRTIQPDSWADQFRNEDVVNVEALVEYVWPILEGSK